MCTVFIPFFFIFLQVPPLGKHYSEKWAIEDLMEEQESGKKVRDEKKPSTLKSSNVENFEENFVEDILKKGSTDINLSADDACPFGPLTQRLLSAFVEENIIAPVSEDVTDPGKTVTESVVIPHAQAGKSVHVPHARNLETRLKQELVDQGIIEKLEGDSGDKVDSGDEVLCELKKKQAELQVMVSLNLQMKRDLLEAAQTEVRKQELRHRVQSADSDVLEWFRKFTVYRQNKKSPTRKEREMANNALRVRETFVRVLNSEEI